MVLEQFEPTESKCQKWSTISRWKGEIASSFFQVIQWLPKGWIIGQFCFYHLPLKKWITYYQFRGEKKVQIASLWFLVKRYNSSNGEVDLMNQCTATYHLDRKSFVIFYLCITFFDLMDIAYVNGYLIYNMKHPNKFSLLDYKIVIAKKLI